MMEIEDILYGKIPIHPWAKIIIEHDFFQRLKKIKQLGVTPFVYPDGNHTRYEHSIGVYHLTGLVLKNIRKKGSYNQYLNTVKDLKDKDLSDDTIEYIKIAGLIHDLGHGPFSHMFDDVFLSIPGEKENLMHEERSIILFKGIRASSKVLRKNIRKREMRLIRDCILKNKNRKEFIYEIVSNSVHNLDVDKLDYLKRDLFYVKKESFQIENLIESVSVYENHICFDETFLPDMISVFTTRYKMHKEVYQDQRVKEYEKTVDNKMRNLEDRDMIMKSVFLLKQKKKYRDIFCSYTDDIIIKKIGDIQPTKIVYRTTDDKEMKVILNERAFSSSKSYIGYVSHGCSDPFLNFVVYDGENYKNVEKSDILKICKLETPMKICYIFENSFVSADKEENDIKKLL